MKTKEKRVKRMENAVKKLENLEGVERAILDDYAPSTACSGQIAVIVEGEEGIEVHDLGVNLRSLAQRMNHALRESEIFNHTVYEKPEPVYNVVDEKIGYNSDTYMVDVVP
jgi:hypothetical protein